LTSNRFAGRPRKQREVVRSKRYEATRSTFQWFRYRSKMTFSTRSPNGPRSCWLSERVHLAMTHVECIAW